MGLTYPFKTSLVLLNEFKIDFVQKFLHNQCKNCSIKSTKIKITQEFRNQSILNCIFSNHQVMLQLLGLERPYVICTCFYLTKVFGSNLTNSTPTFTGA
jgi:hypothetical protein